MNGWLAWLRDPKASRRVAVAVTAIVLAVAALSLLIWSVATPSPARLAWLTSMATIWAFVVPAWGMSVAMLVWVHQPRRSVDVSVLPDLVPSVEGAVVPRLWSLAELDPFELEVHRAVDSSFGNRVTELPTYVERDHDQAVRQVMNEAVDGASRLVVLVGGSSTGKSRTAWQALEVVREVSPEWRLWHPIDPTRPEALLAGLGQVPRYTVLWLNEAQLYLDSSGDDGERVAAALRELLRSPERAPVLVLATLWPEHWDILTTRTIEDLHAQARELLVGHKIGVPEAFTGSALTALAAASKQDQLLAEAFLHATDGQITQYLAGVPVLVDRYEESPPGARALIDAAIDYRRCGYRQFPSRNLLEMAASGYLSDEQWNALTEDWLERSLAYACRPCHGIPGPLTRVRPRPHDMPDASLAGQASDDNLVPLYKVADYLVQYGGRKRRSSIPPASFWATAVQLIDDCNDLVSLADYMRRRWRIRVAVQLYRRAARAGNTEALRGLARFNEERHDLDEAESYYLEAAQAGDSKALLELGDMYVGQEDYEKAEPRYVKAIARGEAKEALLKLGDLKRSVGELASAENYYRRAADAGNNIGCQLLAHMLIQRGDTEEGNSLKDKAASGVMRFRTFTLAEIEERAGGKTEAERDLRERLERRAGGNNSHTFVLLAEMREEAGDEREAESFADQAASEGDPTGWQAIAVIRANRDDIEGAERAARRAVDGGDSWMLLEMAQNLAGTSHLWKGILQFGLEPDGSISSPWSMET